MDRKPFKNRKLAWKWLKKQGYKVSLPKFYQDAEKGLVILNPDGGVSMESLERYIKLADLKIPAQDTTAAANRSDQRHREIIRNLRLKNEKLQHDIDLQRGMYMLKRDCEERLVQALLAFFAYLRSRFFTDAIDILHKIGGEAEKAGLLRKLLENLLNDALHEGSRRARLWRRWPKTIQQVSLIHLGVAGE